MDTYFVFLYDLLAKHVEWRPATLLPTGKHHPGSEKQRLTLEGAGATRSCQEQGGVPGPGGSSQVGE